MKVQVGCVLVLLCACSAPSTRSAAPGAIGFDTGDVQGWRAASTGGTGPDARWVVRSDAHASSSPNVLALAESNHRSEDRFNLFVSDALRFENGRLAVSVRADEGEVDQGGGIAWRVQDANNYYICRVNPLESNFRVYVVKDGVRRQLATALVDLRAGEWHQLEVEHTGDRIRCAFDGKFLLEAREGSIQREGGVGLWTKADARTSFDDLRVEAVR